MLIEKAINIEKVQKEAQEEGILSPAGLVYASYKIMKEEPSLNNIVIVLNKYKELSNLHEKCIICGEIIPPHFARLVSCIETNTGKKILHAHLQHEGTHTLNFILKTIQKSKMVI